MTNGLSNTYELNKTRKGEQKKLNKKKTLALLLVTSLIAIGMLSRVLNIQRAKAEPTTIIVPNDYEKIQWAIGNASVGDTIFVRADTYYENIIVNKRVMLIGENKDNTIIDGNLTESVVHITANNISITGFTVQNSGGAEHWLNSGILVDHSNGNNISNNRVKNNHVGVWIYNSRYNDLSQNHVFSNYNIGIRLFGSINNTITNNNISYNGGGFEITLEEGSNTTVSFNSISSPNTGIWLIDTDYESIICNNISGYYGIVLHNGINVGHHLIVGNTFQSSRWDLHFGLISKYNMFFHNTFAKGVSGSSDSSNIWDNGYPSGGNYWSFYTDVDLYNGPYQNLTGSDGIWDHPYVIDQDNQDNYPLVNPWTTPSRPVGGIYLPANKFELLSPYIGLTVLLAVAVVTVVYVRKRKRNTEINS